MRKSVVFLVVLGLVFVAFSATASAGAKARPFQGCVIGTATFTPGSATDPSPTGVWARPYGVGDVSHLGASVMTGKHPAALTFEDGDMTLVAANGDKVFMEYSGGGPAPEYMGQVYDIWIKFTIVGGHRSFRRRLRRRRHDGDADVHGIRPQHGVRRLARGLHLA